MKGSITPSSSNLDLFLLKAPRPRRATSIRLPGGRLILTRDRGQSKMVSRDYMLSNLQLVHRDGDGKIKDVRDEGSGLVTNAGVNLMSFDFTWAGGATLKQANFHAIGTGTTAATSSDVFLQTAQGTSNLSGTTNGYMTGTQNVIANATSTPWSPIYQTVATFTFTGAVAVTEWVLTIGNGANITHTSNSTTSTSLTDTTNSPFLGTGNGNQLWTVETGGATPVNTPGTTPMGQVASNTTSVLTLLQNQWSSGTKTWLGINNQAVSTPTGASTYVLFPTAWDHKVFSVINAANGDTLQITYQLSINSGG